MNTTVAEIAALVGGTVIGDSSVPITGMNGIRQAGPGDLTFVADSRYVSFATSTNASAILVADQIAECPKTLIQVPEPYLAVAAILRNVLSEITRHPSGIHATAVLGDNVDLGADVALGPHVCVGDDCRIGNGTVVYPNTVIGHHCVIGAGCLIYPNVTIREEITVGDRCVVHAGAVLGSDGFGFAGMDGKHEKIPQVGTVTIGNDVEIGANTAIDRATFGQTVIGDGTKIDNLVQIGHNTRIGKHTVVCGNAGIAGSAVIGDRVTVAAGAGLAGHIEIGDDVVVAAYSGVTKSVKAGLRVFGFPAVEHNRGKRMNAALRQLPEALRTFRDLEARIAHLEEQLHDKTEDDS